MTEPWSQDWILGTYGQTIADRPPFDPEERGESDVTERMGKYTLWRSMFTGKHIEQELTGVPASDNGQKNYRWPSRLNLFKTYAMIHASWLWGRGETGKEATDLFDLELDRRVPGIGSPELTSAAPAHKEALEYWWSYFQHLLRPSGATQQWAGGCWLKVTWNPFHPSAVFGVVLETLDPSTVYPIYDPTSFDTLLAVKIVFSVSAAVAVEKYGIAPSQVDALSQNNQLRVVEYWSRVQFWVKVGPEGKEVTARLRTIAGGPGELLEGPNPWIHPRTSQALIPVFYIPRVRTNGFFGDSLMADLEGPVEEMNKTISDIGDAINDATHGGGFVADNHTLSGRAAQDKSFAVPRGEIMNLGITPVGREQGRYYAAQTGTVPSETTNWVNQLQGMTEQVAMLTPGARGESSATTGMGTAMEMLPTLYTVDWMRSHWTQGIVGRSGINELLGVIWFIKSSQGIYWVPSVQSPLVLSVRQRMILKPVIPRDRIAAIQEISQLSASKALPPREILRRLGDVENIDETLGELMQFLMWMAMWDAAVAGRPVKIGKDMQQDESKAPMPLPEVSGPTTPSTPGGTPQAANKAKEKTA